jgi:hypothetical protein
MDERKRDEQRTIKTGEENKETKIRKKERLKRGGKE